MANEMRMELIDRNAIDYENIWCTQDELFRLNAFLESLPTVDAKPVVYGRWIMGVDDADYDYGICSVCGFAEREHIPCLYIPNYCPHCGADMREVEK